VPAEPAEPLTPEQIDEIYRTLIKPTLFADSHVGEATPNLVLLGGQPGSGKSRASARLLVEHRGMVAVSGDDLRIYHPNFRDLINNQPEQAGAVLADATRPWVRAAIQSALDERRGLLLEGTFGDAEVTLATARRFRDAGFNVHIVAIASPRVLSVVTVASRYLRDLKMGAAARFTRLSAHDHGYDGTARLVNALQATTAVDRVTITSRNGTVLLDQLLGTDHTGASAGKALNVGRHPDSWGARSTMELLGELKQITTFAIESGNLTADVADLLIEAHELTLAQVVPLLSVDSDSEQAKFIQRAVSEQYVALRRATTPADVVEPQAAPRLASREAPALD
jgi:hypothetical protein